jgi:hypothetical protein
MDEDVTPANFLEENALDSVVEEMGIVPGNEAITVKVKDKSQGEVLDAGFTATIYQA